MDEKPATSEAKNRDKEVSLAPASDPRFYAWYLQKKRKKRKQQEE